MMYRCLAWCVAIGNRPEVAPIEFAEHQYPLLNTGVAIVTPIEPVFRVIMETAELVEQRQHLEANAHQGH